MLAFCVLSVTRFNMFWIVLSWLDGVFLYSILVIGDNRFQRWYVSDVSHYTVSYVLELVCGCFIEKIASVRRGCR